MFARKLCATFVPVSARIRRSRWEVRTQWPSSARSPRAPTLRRDSIQDSPSPWTDAVDSLGAAGESTPTAGEAGTRRSSHTGEHAPAREGRPTRGRSEEECIVEERIARKGGDGIEQDATVGAATLP